MRHATIVLAQGIEEVAVAAAGASLRLQPLVGGRIDRFEGQAEEGGVGIKAGE